MITVFTPAYNRAHLLPRLYDSLEEQTCKDFEWVVVDDGSKDSTREVIRDFESVASFPVKYIYQENGGKHRAINRGAQGAQGKLFFIADADDWLAPNTVEVVLQEYNEIKNKKEFGGVCGLDAKEDGIVVGKGLPQDVMECSSHELKYIHNVTGDMKEVFLTSVMKEFPFPEIDGEKFCPEDLVWNRIARKYKLRYFNKVIYLVEYQCDGLTANIIKIRMNSPIASTIHYAELIETDIPFSLKVKTAINYWRFWMCIKKKSDAPGIGLQWSWALPLGWAMHLNDLRKVK